MKSYYDRFKNSSQDALDATFMNACISGDLKLAQYLASSDELENHANVKMHYKTSLHGASENGHLETLKYLLTFPYFKDISPNNNLVLSQACGNGHLNIVKYLLTTPEINDVFSNYDDLGLALQSASEDGHLKVVKYLLTSPELKENADIHYRENCALQISIVHNHLDIIKYLLTSPELNEHINLYAMKTSAFFLGLKFNQLEIIKFFIFDMDIKRNEDVNKYLLEMPNEDIENMFKMRDLNKELKNNLSNDNKNNKKIKL